MSCAPCSSASALRSTDRAILANCCRSRSSPVNSGPPPLAIGRSAAAAGQRKDGSTGNQHQSVSSRGSRLLLELRCGQSRLPGADFSSFRGRETQDSFRAMGTTSSSRSSAHSEKSTASKMDPPAQDASSEQQDFKSISDAEWRQRLTPEQFDVARKKGTERPFSGKYWKTTKAEGQYQCICCNTPLFDSSTKFDSGTGWPSYSAPIGNNVKSDTDWSIPFMPRTEVVCRKCDAHLGHVFDDGPRPTGKRFCINSASLTFNHGEN